MANIIVDGSAAGGVDAYALTSVANLKAYMAVAPVGADAFLGTLVNRASDIIESICDREMMTRSHADWLDGTGSRNLLLPNYPVTAVARVCIGSRDVLSLSNSSTDAAYMTVANDATNITLVVSGGVNASSTDIALAGFATVTLLVAQINATGLGWSASVLNSADAHPTSDLKTIVARGVTSSAVYLTVPEEPVSDYEWDTLSGQLYNAGGWPAGHENIYVAYTGGYATVPDDLEQACIEIALTMYQSRETDRTMTSERLGDYAYTLRAEVDQSGYYQRLLAPYRRRIA